MNLKLPAAVAAALFPLISCSDGPVRRPPPEEPKLTAITLAPSAAMMLPGDTRAFTATGVYDDGTNTPLSTGLEWSSSNTAAVMVDGAGVASAIAPGTAEVTAALGEVRGTAAVTVTAVPITSIAIEPAALSLTTGGSRQLTATATFDDGTTADVTAALAWSSTAPAVARVTAGLVEALSAGAATIQASDPGSGVAANDVAVTVADVPPTVVRVSPSMISIPLGATHQFTATADYADGTMRDVTAEVEWASTNTAVATVGTATAGAGLARSVSPGAASITARHASGVRGAASLIVDQPALVSIVVSPSTPSIARNETVTFTATAHYSDSTTRNLTGLVTWASSDTGIAVQGMGPGQRSTFVGLTPGVVTISATDPMSGLGSDDTNTSATLEVRPPDLVSIAVIPQAPAIALGLELQFQAIGLYDDSSSSDITGSVMWSSSNPMVATIDAAGLADSVGQGVTTISATDPVSGISSEAAMLSATLTVDPPALRSIAVTPATRAMVVGSTQQFTATGLFSDETEVDLTTQVTWSSSSNALSISAAGFASAVAVGNAIVSASDPASMISSNDSNQSASVIVAAGNLVSIAVTPPAVSVPAGADVRFTATGTYDNGATADITSSVEWTSSAPGIATAGNAGAVRGLASTLTAGATSIAAREPANNVSSDNSGGSATLTVTNVALQSIDVLPANPVVDVDDTIQLTAMGTFADASEHEMTNTVAWTSANANIATTGNTEGVRGLVTGRGVGTVAIEARHLPTGVFGSRSVLVELGIVTLSATWPGPTISIDASGQFGVSVGSAIFAAGQFPANAVITDVDVSINFLKTDGSCAAPLSGDAFHGETSFRIVSPEGTQVTLAPTGTWSGGVAISPVTVVFDQSAPAPPLGTPVSGSFQPSSGNLSLLNGQNPTGAWILQAGDSAGGDPLCVNAYTVTVTAQ